MRKVCFTTTSVGRYELMEATYKSFLNNFKGVDYKNSTLFLNLDHYKEFGDIQKSIEVAKSFFGKVVYNISEKPNFAQAVKWCWSHDFDTKYVFHLEDDWELQHEVKLKRLISIIKSDKSIVNVRLRQRGRLPEGKSERILLGPSLFEKEFLKIGSMISPNRNPEHSIKFNKEKSRIWINRHLNMKKTFSYTYTNDVLKKGEHASRSTKDIGLEWKIKNGVGFNGKCKFFLRKKDME
jgi:hypothetical protein